MKNTKHLLIENAIHLFIEKGFDKVTIDDIVQESNLTKGAFYHYFKSKGDILRSYNIYTIEKNDNIKNILNSDENSYNKLLNLILYIYGNSTNNLGANLIVELIINDIKNSIDDPVTISNVPVSTGRYKNLYNAAIDIVIEGQKDGSVKNNYNPKDLINAYTGCVYSSATNWYSQKEKYNRMEELKNFFEIIFKP